MTALKARKASHGKPCPYCGRVMQRGHVKLEPTCDHHIPASRGGTTADIVIACIQCNMIKGDMMPEQWAVFMAATTGWWKLDRHQIRRARHALNLITPGF